MAKATTLVRGPEKRSPAVDRSPIFVAYNTIVAFFLRSIALDESPLVR
jgi:hypothetical protein